MGGFKIGLLVLLILLLSMKAFCQVNRYVVFFKDKTGTPYTIDHPEEFLTSKSLARRAKQGINISLQDLPANPTYITQVKNQGAKTYFTSRWMNAVLCEIHKDSVKKITSLACVDSVVYAAPGNKLSGGRVTKIKNKKSTSAVGPSLPQLQQLGIDEMQQQGYHGENIAIAVLDGGFPGVNTALPFQALTQQNQIKMTWNFVIDSANVYQTCGECSHGTEVLSTMAVNTSAYTGGSYGADFYLFVTEDVSSEYRIEEYNWLFGVEKADSMGVDIISSSLGYNQFDDPTMNYKVTEMDGRTTVAARAASIALSKGMVVVVAAGNEGANSWRTVTTPADAAGVIACGAVDSQGEIAPFSSQGPSADGRIKPDVVATGVGASIVTPTGSLSTNNGTSFSSPLVTSLVAGVLQAFPYLTSTQAYQSIIHSADRAGKPDILYGYGIPYFPAIKNYVEKSDTISLYPNPTNTNIVNIKFTYNLGMATVYFYDIFGRLMLLNTTTIGAENNPMIYDVSGLSAGVYIVKVKSSGATKTFRFVKT